MNSSNRVDVMPLVIHSPLDDEDDDGGHQFCCCMTEILSSKSFDRTKKGHILTEMTVVDHVQSKTQLFPNG
jgi:hypothetical protein